MNVCAIDKGTIRAFTRKDSSSLALYADNPAVRRWLRDFFPSPYRIGDARRFISRTSQQKPRSTFAIDVDGVAVGSIGLVAGNDINRLTAEVGYWLGEQFWGKGIATRAVRSISKYAFGELKLIRLFAVPFADNHASIRVLEKAGFIREAIMRASAIKEGGILDQALYARVNPELVGKR